jgi:hypothetical protein
MKNNDVASILGFGLVFLPLTLCLFSIPVYISFIIGAIVCVVGLITKD